MFNLQMFAAKEAVKGKRVIYLWRIYEEGETATGTTVAFTTENSRSVSKDADSTPTKDGSIRTPGEAEVEISLTSILAKGDDTIDKLEDAMIGDKLIECWKANLDEPVAGSENKFKGIYSQGYFTNVEETSNAEDFVEYSMDFGANGTGARGDVTVTLDQQEIASYVFEDTTLRQAEGNTGA